MILFGVSLTDTDTEECIGNNYKFIIFYAEPQGDLREHLVVLYINGDPISLALIPTDQTEFTWNIR